MLRFLGSSEEAVESWVRSLMPLLIPPPQLLSHPRTIRTFSNLQFHPKFYKLA